MLITQKIAKIEKLRLKTMNNINSSLGMHPNPALSVLKSANKQPELALQLLLKSLAASPQPDAAQSSIKRVPQVDGGSGAGTVIDIIV